MKNTSSTFWSIPSDQILRELKTSLQGLTETEARERLKEYGYNFLKPTKKSDTFTLLLGQFKSPI
jgi:P-type Mg2+ transporter